MSGREARLAQRPERARLLEQPFDHRDARFTVAVVPHLPEPVPVLRRSRQIKAPFERRGHEGLQGQEIARGSLIQRIEVRNMAIQSGFLCP